MMIQARKWIPWLAFAGFAVFIALVIRAANTGQGRRYWSFLDAVPHGDKLGHVLLMGTLCLLLNLALRCRTVPLGGFHILLGTLLVSIFVIGEEISQLFLANRTFDLVDLLADAIGIALASLLARVIAGKKENGVLMTIIFMGVCGSGKSSVGRLFAEACGGIFIEGDELHPPENVARMRAGIPLTDEDRDGWLDNLAHAISKARETSEWVCASCSALKKRYRDRFDDATFVYLKGSRELLQSRMDARRDHFMPPTLLASQLDALEEPDPAEERVIVLDLDGKSPGELVEELRLSLGFDAAT